MEAAALRPAPTEGLVRRFQEPLIDQIRGRLEEVRVERKGDTWILIDSDLSTLIARDRRLHASIEPKEEGCLVFRQCASERLLNVVSVTMARQHSSWKLPTSDDAHIA